ncbi:MAG: cell division protein ZapA [Hyphomicrobiaceae bacterium]|nr:cell division protein ZapA [Hyphomicrobiaceae bacterium]
MGQVTVSLNGRSYRLRCGDGEEGRLAELADYVGRRVDGLALEFGQYGDERLLLMVTLLLADEMLELKAKLAEIEAGAGAPVPAAHSAPAEAAAATEQAAPSGSVSASSSAAAGTSAVAPKTAARPAQARNSLDSRIAEARAARNPTAPASDPDGG